MILRAASVEDAQAIAALQNPFIRDTAVTFNSQEKSVEDIVAAIGSMPFFHVAEDEGRIVGFVSYDQFRKGPGYARCMEHSIILDPSAHRKGFGRALMRAAETHARAAGVGSLWAGVSSLNPDGRAFHARVGFEEIATLPKVGFKFGAWIDLVLMRKWLLDEA